MMNRGKSFLLGAAVAALLIVPAAASNSDWTVRPTKSYGGANAVKLTDIVGKITVDVRNGGPVTVDVAGAKPRVDGVTINQDDGKVVIDGSSSSDTSSVWDWHKWFNFSSGWTSQTDNLTIKVTVPRGAGVEVSDLVGDATIGDTQGELHFDAAATKARIGQIGR